MIVAGTGHRPNKLGGYGVDVFQALRERARMELQVLDPVSVISGMALGWDQALAYAAHDLEIPFTAYVPFEGQESAWPAMSQRDYRDLLGAAKGVVTCCAGGYAPHKLQTRNEMMVDACDTVLALWDGTKGGTGNCIRYAKRVGKPIVNCWLRYTGEE